MFLGRLFAPKLIRISAVIPLLHMPRRSRLFPYSEIIDHVYSRRRAGLVNNDTHIYSNAIERADRGANWQLLFRTSVLIS